MSSTCRIEAAQLAVECLFLVRVHPRDFFLPLLLLFLALSPGFLVGLEPPSNFLVAQFVLLCFAVVVP